MSATPESTPGLHTPPTARRLAGNTAWNLVGLCAPMVAALFAIPILISGLGAARFGTLTIIWMLVGYFSIFDLGLGRAMTKLTAERMGRHATAELPAIFWTALGMMFLLGLLGAALIAAVTPWLAYHRLHLPPELQRETARAFYFAAAGMPLVIATTGLIGILEAHQRFRLINLIRIPTGLYTFLSPLAVLPFTKSLAAVVAALIAGRVIEWLLYLLLCLRADPALRSNPHPRAVMVRPLLTFGGWMTVSNIAMPVMIQIDRFLIGLLLSVTAVAYYATPAEIVVKLLIFPRAWVSVLFPSFAAQYAVNRRATGELYVRGVKYLLLFSFPVILVVTAFAGEGLRWWLGAEFARESTAVMRWLALGIFVYCLAYLPFSLLQAAGRPDLSARLHMAELPLYLLLCVAWTRAYGIQGAAAAWVTRVVAETLCMFRLAHRFVPDTGRRIVRILAFVALAAALIAAAMWPARADARLGAALLAGLLFPALAWNGLFTREERDYLRRSARALRRPRAGAA